MQTQQYDEIIEIKGICYIQGNNGCTSVFLNGGRKLVTTKILKEYEEVLPGTTFLRIHQSYLVNKFYIHRHQRKKGILSLLTRFTH